MSWGLVAVAGATVATGYLGGQAAKGAADTQANAANAATALQREQYDQTRADQAKWREAGERALGQLSSGSAAGGDFNRDFTLSDFQKDPGYQFRLDQGLDSVQGSAAARGSLMSGATLKRLNEYGQNYGSSEYGKAYDRFNNDRTQRFNRLATIAGIGQTATNNVGTAGANYAANAGNNMIGAGNAQAAGQIGSANAINSGVSNLQSLYQLNSLSGSSGAAPYTGNAYYGSNFQSEHPYLS